MKKVIFTLIILATAQSQLCAQHSIVTSQYLQNALPVNPAIAGNSGALTASISYRNEWYGMEGSPVSMVLAVHSPLKNERIAVGLNIWQDSYGATVNRVIKGIGAYRIEMNKTRLSFALALGVRNQLVDYNDLIFFDKGDDLLERGVISGSNFEGGAGIFIENERFFGSVSMPNIGNYPGGNLFFSERNNSIPWNHQNILLGGGYRFRLNERSALRLLSFASFEFNDFHRMDFTLFYTYNDLFEIGLGSRTDKGYIATLRIWINQQLSFAYSYDMWTTDVNLGKGGSHEWVLRYSLKHRQNTPNPHLF